MGTLLIRPPTGVFSEGVRGDMRKRTRDCRAQDNTHRTQVSIRIPFGVSIRIDSVPKRSKIGDHGTCFLVRALLEDRPARQVAGNVRRDFVEEMRAKPVNSHPDVLRHTTLFASDAG